MFTENLDFYGEIAQDIDDLLDSKIFERVIDVFLTGAAIGILYGVRAKDNKSNAASKAIFTGVLNNEAVRIKILAIQAYTVSDENENNEHQREYDLFHDWNQIPEPSDNPSYLIKYSIMKEYANSGIHILHKNVIENSTSDLDYLSKFLKYLKRIDEMKDLNIYEKAIEDIL